MAQTNKKRSPFLTACFAFMCVAAMSFATGCKKEDSKAGKKNPCAGKKNPCGAKTVTNPCGGKKNPCGAKNPCGGKNPCGAKNPCGGKANPCNPCGGKSAKIDPKLIKEPNGFKLNNGGLSAKALLAKGQKLFKDASIGKSNSSCQTCHATPALYKASFAKAYPHAVAMVKMKSGVESVTAAEMVQFCMKAPMKTDPLKWDSVELAALVAVVKHNQKSFKPGAHKGHSMKNPCGAKNPCGGKMNPCGHKMKMKKNPCGH